MKKFLRTGKKALAVFMAVMMVLTAWVFFEPMKAEAATAGYYYVRFSYTVDNKDDDDGGEYTGSAGKNKNGMNVTYTKQDGTTGTYIVSLSGGTSVTGTKTCNKDVQSTGSKTCTGRMDGLPTKVVLHIYGSSTDITEWYLTKVEVSPSSTFSSDVTTLWTGHAGSHNQRWNGGTATITIDIKNNSVSQSGVGTNDTTQNSNGYNGASTATTVKFLSGLASITIPKTGDADFSTSYTAGVYDQYGVRMTYEPTYYVRSSAPTSAQSSSSTITGVTMTSGASSGTLKVTSDAQMQSGDSKNIYIHAKYNALYANKTVTLNDPTYTFTFKNTHGGTPSPSNGATSTGKYYNTYGSTPSGTRTGFTFKGYYRENDVDDSFATDNTSGKTKLTSGTYYDGDYTWYAAWQANQYTATFAYKDASYNNTSSSKTQYYTTALTAPSVTSPIDTGDYTYTFKAWSPSVPSKMPASNNTYTATYTQTPNYADYTEVVKQIGAAESKMDEAFYQEGGYTPASVSAFEDAYHLAVDSNNDKLLKSQQSQVDALAEALKTARENLTLKNYTVVFVDEDGAIIKDGFFVVDYGTKVTAPTAPEKEPDANYHYTFSGWDSTDSDDMSALNKVVDDLKFIAKFTKTAHTMTDTVTTEAGCQNDGVITHTCSDCGYSYTTAGDKAKHTWSDYVTITPATCSTVGKKAKQCTKCGVYSDLQDIAKTSHSFSAWTNYQAATCGAQGVQTRTCANCGQLEVQKTAATGRHSYVTKHTCAATCTADGYTVKVCSVCGNTTITTATKLGHNLTTTTTQAATCASVGVKETKCSRCDYGKTEIVAATGTHSYGAWTTISTANCISKGVKTRECSVCGKVETDITNQTAHSWGAWTDVTPATCTGKGVQKRTCPTCGQSETRTTNAKGHTSFDSSVVDPTCTAKGYTINICKDCGYSYTSNEVAALGHSLKMQKKDPTCTEGGYTGEVCERCGYLGNVTAVDPLGHDWNDGVITTPATCEADGTKTYTCKRTDCGATKTEIIPKTGHNYTAGEAVAPFCTTSGYTPYTCTACGDTYNVYDSSKPATGHTWGDWTVTKAPTETVDGEQTRTCSKCGATETAPVPATSHTLVEDTTKYVAPTCTKDGEKVYKCTATHPGQTSPCTYTTKEVLPKTGHTLSTTKTNATCTADGKVVTSCSRCDYKAETVIPATGHSYTNTVTTQPTCTAAGVRTYTCQHDSTHTYTEAIEKLPHDFKAGTPVAATCTESGYTPYKCENCDEAYVKITAPAKGHSYKDVANTSTATCTTGGTQDLRCEFCSVTIKANVPALGHDYQKTADTTATCAAAATETYKCSRCDANYTISVGDKTTAHDWNEWKVVENATYDSLGYKTRDCKVCGKLEVETIPCLGDHVFDNETGRQPATCTEDGYIDYACSKHSDCGATSRVLLPKTGHTLSTTKTNATCTVDGKVVTSCSKCDFKIETAIPATGHAWNAGVVAKQPTCTAVGEMTYTCSVCPATKTDVIAVNPNAHVYTAGAVTPATCVTPELTTYSCLCGKVSEIKQTAPAKGHKWKDTKEIDKNATCTVDGSKSTHCSACDATKDAEVIAKTGHSFTTQKVDPTCTESGYTAEVCEKCGWLKSVTAVDPLGHTWGTTPTSTTDATCTEAGTATYTCTNVNNGVACTETKTEITQMPLGHNWGNWFISKPATDTEKGEKKRVCNNDPKHVETCEIPTIGHKWNAGTVKKAATCYEVGTMLYTCTGCDNCKAAGPNATLEVEIPKTEHTYTQVTTPATCTADGSTVVKCSVDECGYVAQTVTIPATGHTLERDTASDKAPTCTVKGEFVYKCKNTGCDYTEKIERDPLGHDYSTTAVTVTEPTCTTDGVKAYKCTRCDAKIETAIPKTGHDFSITEVIAPTCTEKGYTIKRCANCTENYVVSDSFIDAKGHAWGDWTTVTEPTNDKDGLKKRVCGTDPSHVEYAPIPMLGHEWNAGEVTTPATCTTEGLMTYTCIKAGCATCNGTAATRTEVIPATGHNYDGVNGVVQTPATCTTPPYQTWTCQNAGCGFSYIIVTGTETGHNYKKTVTAATCEADGNEHYVCTNANCGHEYDVVLPKLGHNYKTEVTAPTCSTYGYTTYTCQNDATHTYKSDFVPTVAHNYAKDDALSVPATCVSKGYDVMVCTNVIDNEGHTCGVSYKVITNATGHDYDTNKDGVVNDDDATITTAATCTTNGVKTYTCGNCGDTYTEVIPATGHTYGEGVVVREADGGNTGLIEYTCKTCGDKFYEEYVTDSTIHNWTIKEQHDATCDNAGSITYKCTAVGCSKCTADNYATFTKQIPALGHDYVGAVKTAPTCTATGVMTYTCSRCDATYTEEIPATGHNPQKVKDVPATCISAGYTEYVCDHVDADGNKCGYTMYDNYIAPLTHDLKVDVIAPTCTTAGYTLATCQRAGCGYTNITNVTEAKGHVYNSAITTPATCTTDGVKTYTCTRTNPDGTPCGHSYTETVAKTGHAWGEWVTTKNPTATEEGEKSRTCANVNCPVQKEIVKLPKLGHTMVAGKVKVQPTCTTTGVQEYVCTEHTGDAACGYTYEVTLPALGHDWNDGAITTAATCTADGEKTYTCKRDGCGAIKTEVVPKTGHDMETAVTNATCVSDKFTTYTCKSCGYSYVINETGTALGHTFSVVVESVDATCEAKGYTIYKCERCDATKTETTEALGHVWGEWKTTTPATCSERGVETRVCLNNPTHIQTRRTNTVDHDFVSTLYHPTCTESGFTILACKGCGKTIRTDFVPAYGHKYDEGVYEDATCTTPGGIRYTCTNINPDGTPCGHSYLVKDTEPLGHIWGAWHYVEHPTVENAYAKQRDCTRGSCTVIEYERGKMSNEDDINVYYKVEFFNPWTTDEYYELNNGRTKLAKTYKTEKVNEAFYLVGDEVTYPSKVLPQREKDYTWGGYKLIDWTYDEHGQTQSALNDMKSIAKNMTVYANFEGYDVYYKVAFWNEATRLTIDEVILHGHAAQYPFAKPTKADNLHYKYEFTGWDYDYTAIYDSVAICAQYNQIAKKYNIVYCDWNGKELASEEFEYSTAAKNAPTGLTRPADATYIYEFSGKWQTQPGKEEYIDLNHLTVPENTPEGGTIKVYAKYYQKARDYKVTVYGHGINGENIPGATVQILSSNGYLVTTAKLDEESKAIFLLNYDTAYTVSITDGSGNVGEATFVLPTDPKDPKYVDVNLKQYTDPDHGGSNCHCICHSFLSGLWISMLNIIYNLFGKKIVCCYDMYATHGDRLAYGE